MTVTPLLPRNAPFLPEDIDMLNKVVARTTPQQRSWLAGFSRASRPRRAAAAPGRAGGETTRATDDPIR